MIIYLSLLGFCAFSPGARRASGVFFPVPSNNHGQFVASQRAVAVE